MRHHSSYSNATEVFHDGTCSGTHITNYIGVDSVDEYSSKVEKLGGRLFAAKHAVPGMGYFALCSDTENNVFAIWESDENAK